VASARMAMVRLTWLIWSARIRVMASTIIHVGVHEAKTQLSRSIPMP